MRAQNETAVSEANEEVSFDTAAVGDTAQATCVTVPQLGAGLLCLRPYDPHQGLTRAILEDRMWPYYWLGWRASD